MHHEAFAHQYKCPACEETYDAELRQCPFCLATFRHEELIRTLESICRAIESWKPKSSGTLEGCRITRTRARVTLSLPSRIAMSSTPRATASSRGRNASKSWRATTPS